jgi:hypothetical protein
MGLTCTVSAAWIFYHSRPVLLRCKKSEATFQDRNVPLTCGNVELRGFEPLTSCMPYRPGPSPDVAWCRPACRLPVRTVGGRGLASPRDCRCWLPTWLPQDPLANQSSMYSNKLARGSRRLTGAGAQRLGTDGSSAGQWLPGSMARILTTPYGSCGSFYTLDVGRNFSASARTLKRNWRWQRRFYDLDVERDFSAVLILFI